jgi:sterol desaturase/sphingolipid hydroxylase (fatty acid hydroxylase superfamily)
MPYTEYWFWLILISACMVAMERAVPWRKGQRFFTRPQLLQDVFWLVFNGYVWGVLVSALPGDINLWEKALSFESLKRLAGVFDFLSAQPLWVQAAVYLVISDLLEWCIHNLLHRVGWMWKLHRVHHSIHIMDWIGNFRFHWSELIIYRSLKYLPIMLLGAAWQAVLIAAIISTAIGFLNHANLRISWGPLRYVLNSPVMHLWHHDRSPDRPAGSNFAVVFSFWDWIFGTAYMPLDRVPEELGFQGDQRFPDGLTARFFAPFLDRPRRTRHEP